MNKIKVAAYCRVSTDFDDQLNSLSVQISYFTEYINNHDGYELIEVYYDEGITGTSTKKRNGFNRMISDCENGKINLILTKEVSRFARNTVDTLNYTRRLSELNVGVIFMNDGIDTRDKDGELRLTIMSSIAQEESRKISERVKWGMRRRMEKGVVLGCGRIYGYKVIGGKLEIVPEEAEIIKDIFHMYLYDGKGSTAIAKELDGRGIPTLKNRVWSGQHVLKILNNEKYAGDLTQWKVYKPNVLAEKTFINHGDNPNAPLITVKNHHEPIVSREVFDAVQEERKRRGWLTREGKKHSNSFWLSGKMVCGKCGYSYIMSGSSKNTNICLRCRNRALYGKEKHTAINGELIGCDAHTVDERIVATAMKNILEQINELRPVLEKQMFEEIQDIQLIQKDVDVTPLKEKIAKLENKKHKAIDLMLDDLISKDNLKKQTEIYDNEIARITEEIARNQDIAAKHNTQMAEIKKTVEYMQKLSDCTSESKELYRSLLKQIVVPDYRILDIYLNGVPFGFHILYTVKKAPSVGIYDVIIDSCEIIS